MGDPSLFRGAAKSVCSKACAAEMRSAKRYGRLWDPTASFGSIDPLTTPRPGRVLPEKARQEFFYFELTLAVIDASPGAAMRACSRRSATSLALTLSITSSKLQG